MTEDPAPPARPGRIRVVDRVAPRRSSRPPAIESPPGEGPGDERRILTAVALEPLPEPAMRALLAGFVPGFPGTAANAILSRADRIPQPAREAFRHRQPSPKYIRPDTELVSRRM